MSKLESNYKFLGKSGEKVVVVEIFTETLKILTLLKLEGGVSIQEEVHTKCILHSSFYNKKDTITMFLSKKKKLNIKLFH